MLKETLFKFERNQTPCSFIMCIAYDDDHESIFSSNEKKQSKCKECRRPFLRSVDEEWRKYCSSCYLKIKGESIDCAGCDKKILVFPSQLENENLCRECYKEKYGKPKVCLTCFGTFYIIDKGDQIEINDCYDCHLKKNGIRIKCSDCKKGLHIKKEDKIWKKRCYDCWINKDIKKH